MSKTLFLVRHAEAAADVRPDIYRPLTSTGIFDAARMSKQLADVLQHVSYIITSNAERTQQTTRIFCEQLGLENGIIHIEPSLYESALMYYLNAITAIPAKVEVAMLVAHNPTISYFAEYLSNYDLGGMPTCGVVGIRFDLSSWAEISKRSGEYFLYKTPVHL